MSKYNFTQIEKKWQRYWDEHRLFQVAEDARFPKEKRRYVLDMFPYPSGAGLHVGHLEGYTATDIYSRFLRMRGYNVLHPMGFDAFGLPAENYAIKTGTHPRAITKKNIARFKEQLHAMGYSYDYEREIQTCDADYYKWTQLIFLRLFKKGLAYEKEAPINWCPSCKTGLANEEVKEGKCERCGAPVERKNLRQWMLKITAYAEKLLIGLDDLDWPESIKTMQRNWIGKSEGAEVIFTVLDAAGNETPDTITVYTTRPDTLFGASYISLAPEHTLVPKITTPAQKESIEAYIRESALKSDLQRTELSKEKTGVFTGSYAKNPINGEKLPIWISDYILASYGTGAIMAVPAHDERDWEFAKKFHLPIKTVVVNQADYEAGTDFSKEPETCMAADGVCVNSGAFSRLPTAEAKKNITAVLEKQGAGKPTVNYKLRDWVFSRQRYWGEPIPIVHCPHCGAVPVPERELPLTLPEVEKYEPSGTGESPLSAIETWVNTTCPVCGAKAKRETNTMPQWAGSCWYYLRYLDPHNDKAFVAPEKEQYWMPVDLYVGGAEHAVLHLLYARFWHRFLFDEGLLSTPEPFQRLINQGLITSFGYMRANKSLVPVDMVKRIGDNAFEEIGTGEKLTQIVTKMSKSLKNVVSPDGPIADYGADACRLYVMFMGPLQMSKPWNTQGLIGVYRFLEKVWALCDKEIIETPENDVSTAELKKIAQLTAKTVKAVTEQTASLDFNTAISQMMIFVNEVGRGEKIPHYVLKNFILCLAPYAPHLAEELYEKIGEKPSVLQAAWPAYDEKLCVDSSVTIAVQINGKLRAKFDAELNTAKDTLEKTALADKTVQKWIAGKPIKKIIVVPNKIVNIVI